jgi:four helix bundle protein
MKIALKELRETRINLRIIKEKPIITNEKLQNVLLEVNQLIAIFSSSISTAKKNQ